MIRKNIVILSAFLSPMRSGAEACAEEVPLALKDQYNFTIVTARMRRDLPKNDMLKGSIPVVRVGLGFTFDKWLFPLLAPRAVRKLCPEVVHAVLETFAGLALVFCSAPKKILTCQTTNRSFLKSTIVRNPQVITVISNALMNTVRGFGRKDAILISNGIDLSSLNAARESEKKVPGRVLFVGRLEKQKGIDTLLHAFAELSPGAHLRIVGDGAEWGALQKLTTRLGITDRVEFVGRVEPYQIAKEYALAEVFCGLSRSEALGNVFLEAQAAGCAVIGTRVGGIPDIIADNKTGLLVDPDNMSDAVIALQKVLSDKTLRAVLAKAGSAHAQNFSWEAIAYQYAKLY
jgi:glycosyltransferase involved in cell wall biosynthesis